MYFAKMKKALSALFSTLLFSFFSISAQEAIPASGGEATGEGGSASYTVGQVFYTTISGETGSVAEGVQQPYEISVVTAIEDVLNIDLSIRAYPNPATDYLNLKIDPSAILEKYVVSLFDINGKMLLNKNIETFETQLNIGDLTQGTYFLKVFGKGQELKVFKIVKN